MRNDLTDITILLDRSGSMSATKDDTIGGFNQFIQAQREGAGTARVTLVQFNHVYEKVYEGPVADVPLLDKTNYYPTGFTALCDSLCRLIDETGARLKGLAENERPGLVIFFGITDGQENASRKYTRLDAHARVTHQEQTYKWQFVWLAANLDAFVETERVGIAATRAAMYQSDIPDSVRAAYRITGQKLNVARGMMASGQSIPVAAAAMDWTSEERKEIQGKDKERGDADRT